MALGPEKSDLCHHRRGPHQAHHGLAVAQGVEIEREKDVHRGVRQHREKDGGKKPGHLGPAQHAQHGWRLAGVVPLGCGVRQAPTGHAQERVHTNHHHREPSHAQGLKQRAKHQHGTDKTQRAPHAHTAITCAVNSGAGLEVLRKRGLRQRHDTAIGKEQQQGASGHRRITPRPQQTQRCHQRSQGRQADELRAAATVVAPPTPGIGGQDARPGLQGRNRTNGEGRKPQLFEPQRRKGVEGPHGRKVAKKERAKSRQAGLGKRGCHRVGVIAWASPAGITSRRDGRQYQRLT